MPLEQFEAGLRTNLIGPFLCAKAFIGAVPEGSRVRIINISSVHEDMPRAGAADYCALKRGLRNMTRCLALELAPRGITVNNLAPGMVLTPMNQEAMDDPARLAEQVASIPLKRAAEPNEVAELALYIASAAGAYATAAIIRSMAARVPFEQRARWRARRLCRPHHQVGKRVNDHHDLLGPLWRDLSWHLFASRLR